MEDYELKAAQFLFATNGGEKEVIEIIEKKHNTDFIYQGLLIELTSKLLHEFDLSNLDPDRDSPSCTITNVDNSLTLLLSDDGLQISDPKKMMILPGIYDFLDFDEFIQTFNEILKQEHSSIENFIKVWIDKHR